MALRVAINGFGRIGRLVLRSIAEHGRRDIEVVAINDLGPVETNAHLLRYDSVHGRFPGVVTSGEDWIDVGMGKIKVTAIRNPEELPHKDLGVDIAFECTGIFTAKDKASAHLKAGAKRVLDDEDNEALPWRRASLAALTSKLEARGAPADPSLERAYDDRQANLREERRQKRRRR